ncbi:MAG: tRNA (N(6)-L-threonylcarbamoyladenosine(37)-C(2))-methylthiotransferase [Candidatus Hodarchaeota archaeon]
MTKTLRLERTRVRLESYGCTSNQGASEIMAGLLQQAGFEISWGQGEADLIILNTCIVKSATHSKMLRRLRKIGEDTPSIPLIVAGCMPQVYKDDILQIAPNVSVMGPHDLRSIVAIARSSLAGHLIGDVSDREREEIRLNFPRLRQNSLSGIVQIARGCLSSCSYCIVKKVMGNVQSYPPEQILEEIKTCIRDGCREILLTAQDLGVYGTDIGNSLSALLERILSYLPPNVRLRLGMLNPGSLRTELDNLLNIISHKSVYSMLHLPIQSGDDTVLQTMGRSYSISEFKRIVNQIRLANPHMTIHTDVIVGFPSETETAFENTVDLIKWLKPDVVNISKFSPRPGTKAAQMKLLPSQIIKARSKALAALCSNISFEKNRNFVKEAFEVLTLRKHGEKEWFGRTNSYKPVVYTDSSSSLGALAIVYINSATRTHLVGEKCF